MPFSKLNWSVTNVPSPKCYQRSRSIPPRTPKGEYQGCPPAVVRGEARHAATASSVSQTVKLPRWRRAASYAAEFTNLRFCLGMW